ncbi:macrophage mannose receptor 1-like [Menidia menidia]
MGSQGLLKLRLDPFLLKTATHLWNMDLHTSARTKLPFQLALRSRGLSLLLLAGLLLPCDLQPLGFQRHLRLVTAQKNWTEARRFCSDRFTQFATIGGGASAAEALRVAGGSEVWIGLSRSWTWSQDSQVASYTNWGSEQPKAGQCALISSSGTWFSAECSSNYPYICYNAMWDKFTVYQILRSWSYADYICRNNFQGLANIKTQEDNQRVASALANANPLFPLEFGWIGLSKSELWADGSGAPYRQWYAEQPHPEADCVSLQPGGGWTWRPCGEEKASLCSLDVRPKLQRLKLRLTSGAADLGDGALLDAIRQQLDLELRARGGVEAEFRLIWRTQPDGSVLHREAPPAGRH